MRSLLIDLDGVLYVGNEAVPGADDAIDWLDKSGLPHLYVTNTTSRPRAAIVDRLERLGFRIKVERILTPPVAAAAWLESRELSRIALFVPENTAAEFSVFERVGEREDVDVDAVIVGDLGEGWDFATLNRAFRLLMQKPQPRLVALGMTRYWRAPDGLRLDTAPFVVALAHASGAAPVVLGKPAAEFFQAALGKLDVSASETVMIGDDIRTDVQGAQRLNLYGVLVRTGKFREEDLTAEIEPNAVLDSIADLPGWWERQAGSR